MTLRVGKAVGWTARILFFVFIAACIAAVQADRSAGSNRSLAQMVPEGLGGTADEVRARAIVMEDSDKGIELASGIVARRPVSASHLGLLGLAAAEGGDLDLASQALSLGARRGWRDDYTQIAVLSSSSASGDFEAALQRLEALVRTERSDEIIRAAFLEIAGREEAKEELTTYIGSNDTLQRRLMAISPDYPDILPSLTEAMHSAEALSPQPACEMLNDLTRIHLRRNSGVDAAASWPARCVDGDSEGLGFDSLRGADHQPYRWTTSNAVGVSVFPLADDDGVSLVNRSPLKQEMLLGYLRLPPGQRTVMLELESKAPQEAPMVDLTIRCVEGRPARVLGTVETRVSESLDFTVPSDCPSQRVNIRMRKGRINSMNLSET